MNMLIYLLSLMITTSLCATPLQLHGPQLSPSLMLDLKERFNIEVLVETGTWGADTAKRGSSIFREVYTVELDHDLFVSASKKLAPFSNVYPFEGHSPAVLKQILPNVKGRVLFWLDAHWCGENTARFEKNSPIRDELLAIKESGVKTGVILIDDIRCFCNLPDELLGYGGYPLLSEIKEIVMSINPNYEFWVLGDMAIAFLKEDHVEVSPLVFACTMSRLFTEVESGTILETESIFIDHCNDPDSSAIDFLQCFIIPSTEFITYHLMLWKGLIELGRQNFSVAASLFEKVLQMGYRHWRIYLYLAKANAGQAINRFGTAQDLFLQAAILQEKK